MSESFIKAQAEARAKAWEAAKGLLDRAAEEKRDLTAEENEQFDRINTELDERAAVIESVRKAEEREAKAAEAARGFETREGVRSDNDILRAIAMGEVRNHEFEKRATLVSSNNTVPQSFYSQVFEVARLVGPMLDTSEIISTSTGENLTIPTLTAYSTPAISAQGGTVTESEPTFSSITLGAYKYGVTIPVSNELLNDAGFDISGVLARQAGEALGFVVNGALTTGTGTVQPTGIVTAAAAGGTGSTGVAGAFSTDNLIDLVYSLDGAARLLPGVGFQMSRTGLAAVRKLKDNNGLPIFNLATGQPDTILGYPVFENPAIAAVGTGTKSVIFGHLPSYKVRMAGGLQVAQSSDVRFEQDTTVFRFIMRLDGNLTHASHVKTFQGGAS
jgi:HK97 family phage major capsid protein